MTFLRKNAPLNKERSLPILTNIKNGGNREVNCAKQTHGVAASRLGLIYKTIVSYQQHIFSI